MIFNISQPIDKLANKKLFIESLSADGSCYTSHTDNLGRRINQ